MRRIKARKGWDKYFSLDYVCIHDRRHRERCVDKKTAGRLEEKRIKERATGVCIVCEKKKARNISMSLSLRFQDISAKYLEWEKRKGKKSAWRDEYSFVALNDYFGDKLITQIKPYDVECFKMQRLESGKANGTVNREIAILRRMFNVLINLWQFSGLNGNPVKSKLEPPNMKFCYLEPDEVKKLESYCYDKGAKGLLVISAIRLGLRKNNLFNLRWGYHLNIVTGLNGEEKIDINIPAHETKNSEPIHLAINDKILVSRVKELRGDSEFVFPSEKTGKAYKDLRVFLRYALKESGVMKSNPPERLRGFCWHSLRHTFASQLTKKGVNIQSLMTVGGWKSVKMVMRYSHLSPQDIEDTLSLLDDKETKSSNLVSNLRGRTVGEGLK